MIRPPREDFFPWLLGYRFLFYPFFPSFLPYFLPFPLAPISTSLPIFTFHVGHLSLYEAVSFGSFGRSVDWSVISSTIHTAHVWAYLAWLYELCIAAVTHWKVKHRVHESLSAATAFPLLVKRHCFSNLSKKSTRASRFLFSFVCVYVCVCVCLFNC